MRIVCKRVAYRTQQHEVLNPVDIFCEAALRTSWAIGRPGDYVCQLPNGHRSAAGGRDDEVSAAVWVGTVSPASTPKLALDIAGNRTPLALSHLCSAARLIPMRM